MFCLLPWYLSRFEHLVIGGIGSNMCCVTTCNKQRAFCFKSQLSISSVHAQVLQISFMMEASLKHVQQLNEELQTWFISAWRNHSDELEAFKTTEICTLQSVRFSLRGQLSEVVEFLYTSVNGNALCTIYCAELFAPLLLWFQTVKQQNEYNVSAAIMILSGIIESLELISLLQLWRLKSVDREWSMGGPESLDYRIAYK